jgi:hypothetical protein
MATVVINSPGTAALVAALRRSTDDANRQLELLVASGSRAAVLVANRVAGVTSARLGAAAAEHVCRQSALAGPLSRFRGNFESHVLAAAVLEASDAKPTSVMAVLRRGLEALGADLASCDEP